MKSIKKVAITLFSAVALSGMGSVMADNSANVSADGFLELTVQEVAPAAAKPAVRAPKPKQVRTKSVSQVRAERKKRALRLASKKRAAAKRAKAKRAQQIKRSKTYRVRSGDTLTQISRKTGVSVSRLVRLNRLYGSKKNHIEVGQRLRLR